MKEVVGDCDLDWSYYSKTRFQVSNLVVLVSNVITWMYIQDVG